MILSHKLEMKSLIFLITISMFGQWLVECGSEWAILHPFTTVTNVGMSNYRSLSSTIRMLNSEYVLPVQESEYVFKHEQKIRDQVVEELRKKSKRHNKKSRKAIPGATDFLIYYRSVYKTGIWFFRMYTARTAHKKLSKAEQARRLEYYCGDTSPEKLKEYCRQAFIGNKFTEKKGWHYNEKANPECLLKHVILKQYDHTSERGVLKCPILVKREGEPDSHQSAYISSVDDPQKDHLVFYLFVIANQESEESLPIDESSQNTSKDTRNIQRKNDSSSLKSYLPSSKQIQSAATKIAVETALSQYKNSKKTSSNQSQSEKSSGKSSSKQIQSVATKVALDTVTKAVLPSSTNSKKKTGAISTINTLRKLPTSPTVMAVDLVSRTVVQSIQKKTPLPQPTGKPLEMVALINKKIEVKKAE